MIDQLVEQIEGRFEELERMMSDPEVIADRERYAEVGREYRELAPAHELAREYTRLRDDLEGARELLAEDGDDPELRKLVAEAPGRLERLAEEIRLATVESDPNDSKNVLVEIRAGTGGGEAALFAGDLFKMLTRYAEQRGFSTEVLSQSPAEVGGFKEVTFAVKGEGAYSVFKYEGGTCGSCAPGCTSRSSLSSRRRSPPSGAPRWGPESAPRRCGPTTSRRAG